MNQKYLPDEIFDEVTDINPLYFVKSNIKLLILDIDNTLARYSEPIPSKDVRQWFSEIEEQGIKLALISNNSEKRVYKFNSVCGFLTYSRAHKPSPKGVFYLMERLNVKPEYTAVMGDQIFTDVLCARRAGVRAYLVHTLETKGRPFLKIKKAIETPFVKEFYRLKHGKKKKN